MTLTLVNNIFAFNADPIEGGSTGIYLGAEVNLVREGHNLYWSREGEEITAEFVSGRDDPGFPRAAIADGTWTTFTGQGQGDVTADPLFVSNWPELALPVPSGAEGSAAEGVDLHLQVSSPAVNAGSVEGAPSDDIEGHPRDDHPDIGAYER